MCFSTVTTSWCLHVKPVTTTWHLAADPMWHLAPCWTQCTHYVTFWIKVWTIVPTEALVNHIYVYCHAAAAAAWLQNGIPQASLCMFIYYGFNILYVYIYRVSHEECARLRESVPYVKVYRYNPKHLYPKLNGHGDNGQRSLKLWQLLHTYWLPNTY